MSTLALPDIKLTLPDINKVVNNLYTSGNRREKNRLDSVQTFSTAIHKKLKADQICIVGAFKKLTAGDRKKISEDLKNRKFNDLAFFVRVAENILQLDKEKREKGMHKDIICNVPLTYRYMLEEIAGGHLTDIAKIKTKFKVRSIFDHQERQLT
jgi:hypothetical protein